jgi:L-lactate dehydrogenase complex protein LldF
MQVQSMHFQARAGQKLADSRLQRNLKRLSEKFVTARSHAMTEIDFEATREAAVERRNRAIDNLDIWLELFEKKATEQGAKVLFAENAAQASDLVV